jgi:hypothetical protein
MPYPDTYEIVSPLTYDDCVLYNSKLSDGFLDVDDEYSVGFTHNVYAKHLSPTPTLEIFNQLGQLVIGPLTSTYNSDLLIHSFSLDLSSALSDKYILKLTATDYPVTFTKVVKFTNGDPGEVIVKLNQIESLIRSTNQDELSLITSTGKRLKIVN